MWSIDRWVPPRATRLRRVGTTVEREAAGELEPLMEAALRDGGGLVVLGAFGSGKTELSRRLGARLGVPVVPLRVVARAADPEVALERLVGTAEVAILDGLDEIGRPHEGGAAELVAVCLRRVRRWVLTSRPGHVRTDMAEPDPHQLDAFAWPLVEIDPYPPPLDAPGWLAHHPVLWPLWRRGCRGARPMEVVEAFLAGLPEAEALEALSWRAFVSPEASMESASFAAADVAGLPEALFVEDLDGRWRFGHRSLYDALVARHLAPLLAAGQGGGPDALTGLALSGAMRTFLAGAFAEWAHDDVDVFVPRGNFVRGGARSTDERPCVIVHLAEPLRLARVPVLNREFRAFTDVFGVPPGVNVLKHWRLGQCPEALLEHAVTWLRPDDGDAYAAWVGARVPSADEWEKAVRGWDGRNFPWGDTFDPARANTAESGDGESRPATAWPQGSGLYDAIGDSFELTASDYRGRPDRGRVVMGGSCAHAPMRASLRLSHTLSGVLRVGLRLAR